jgi:hypothetical protein
MNKITQKVNHLIPYEYSDKKISPWGGMRVVKECYDRVGLHQKIRSLPLHKSGSAIGYEHFEVIESFMMSVILGAGSMMGASQIGYDDVLREIFQWERGMPSQSSLSRFFQKYGQQESDALFSELLSWWFDMLDYKNLTLDIDSTVITRYGNQEGASKGYNPRKKGRKSHHPIMAFVAEPKMVVNGWMRTGDSASSTEFKEFLDNTFTMIGQARVGLVRGDSGFSGNEVLNELEKKGLNYIIALPMKAGLVTRILEPKKWVASSVEGADFCSFEYQAKTWGRPRRVVVVRKDIEKLPNSGGKTLFSTQDDYLKYRYSAFVADTELSDELVWVTYRHRAEAENQIKELKYDYALEGFCLDKMEATEFAFRWVLMAYNFMSFFRNAIAVSSVKHTLSTLKFKCIAIGAYLTTSARQKKLMLAVPTNKRDYIDSLFHQIDNLNHFSTA